MISNVAAISACEIGRQGQQALGLVKRRRPPPCIYLLSECEGQQALGLRGGDAAAAVVPDVISYHAAISACEMAQQLQ